jgi:DNA-directed RNA polymerase specialized sigma24 family protein
MDPVLEPFLTAPPGSAAEQDALRVLMDRVTPIIEGVVRGKAEGEELFSETVLQLIRRLQAIKPDPARPPITDFNGYAAVTAFNVVNAHFRRRPAPVESAPEERIDETESIESSLIYRSALLAVWREIDLLPARQRIALLLGLRDENGSAITSLLILLRIATFDQLAAAVELSPAELAAIWDQLPLPDMVIAERLDLNRQQVINLRKSARDRLGRRLAFLRGGNPLLDPAS